MHVAAVPTCCPCCRLLNCSHFMVFPDRAVAQVVSHRLSTAEAGFALKSVRAGFAVSKVALGEVLRFPLPI